MKRSMLRCAPPVMIVAAIGTVIWVNAGDLNPPSGGVAPTMKPLTEIEPRIVINQTNTPGDANSVFRITQSGSYYLAGNVVGVSGKSGIEIAADGVNIDLNGFTVNGVAATLAGITTAGSSLVRISVQNGAVAAFIGGGIDLVGPGAIVSDVRVRVCVGMGIKVGEGAIVKDCTSTGNQGKGIVCGTGSLIERCTVRSNTTQGIEAGNGVTIRGCSISSSGQAGASVGEGCVLADCSFTSNGQEGLLGGRACRVSSCSSYGNSGDGYSLFEASVVSGCSAVLNGGTGINVFRGSSVVDCSTKSNTSDGIRCSDDCLIRGNMCTLNGEAAGNGAAIYATGSRNRVEGNNCSQADRGVEVLGSGNIIIRNSCAANGTDWVIASNNIFGPIIDRRSVTVGAVSGFSATSSLGSTDANANYSY